MIKITYKVEGMMCPMCESHANEAALAVKGVKKATSSHKTGETVVICDDSTDVGAVADAIIATGYKVTDSKCEPYKKGFFSLFRR